MLSRESVVAFFWDIQQKTFILGGRPKVPRAPVGAGGGAPPGSAGGTPHVGPGCVAAKQAGPLPVPPKLGGAALAPRG